VSVQLLLFIVFAAAWLALRAAANLTLAALQNSEALGSADLPAAAYHVALQLILTKLHARHTQGILKELPFRNLSGWVQWLRVGH
jgi:hypothetical protein